MQAEEASMRIVPLAIAASLAFAASAHATWKPEYANSPPDVQEWYRNAELT